MPAARARSRSMRSGKRRRGDPRPLFENLKLQYPEVMTRLARIALRRVQRHAATPGAFLASDAVSFAVLPVGASRGGVPLTAFSERLALALAAGGTTLHLSSARLEELLCTPGIAQTDAGSPSEADAG